MARSAVASIRILLKTMSGPAYSGTAASPPEAAALGRLDLAGVGNDRAVEGAVERREHASFDEVEGRRLAVTRARQVAGDLLIEAPGPRAHHHDPVGEHDRLLDVVGDHDQGRLELGPEVEEMHLQIGAGKSIERRERLVQEQHLRTWHQRARDRDTL